MVEVPVARDELEFSLPPRGPHGGEVPELVIVCDPDGVALDYDIQPLSQWLQPVVRITCGLDRRSMAFCWVAQVSK